MTGQIHDTVILRGQEWQLVGISGTGLFNPVEQNIHVVMLHTGCYRGYYCTYEIADSLLRLREVFIGLNDLDIEATTCGAGPLLFGKLPAYSSEDFCFAYRDLDKLIPFTGVLQLGRELIHELYEHLGYQQAWKFTEVCRVIFKNGRVTSEIDDSRNMAARRRHTPKQVPEDDEAI